MPMTDPASSWAGLAFAFAFGLAVGSFLNVVIHRLPRGESIVRPRSQCPSCRTPIAAWHNVPLLSYLWLRGRCRDCGARISPRYPAIEALGGLAFAALFATHGVSAATPLWWAFAAALIAAAAIDFDEGFIPDEISLGGLGLGLVLLPVARWLDGDAYGLVLAHGALGAALGAGSLWAVGFAHARLSVALGRSFPHWPGEGEAPPRPGSLDYWMWFPGLGFGDVKLLGLVGAFLGPAGAVQTILLASLIGLPLGLWLVRRGSDGLAAPFGFGPAIAAAALVVAVVAPDGVWPL
jgi:leader peptidase (prepilin peptidase)/N-methyltransferase